MFQMFCQLYDFIKKNTENTAKDQDSIDVSETVSDLNRPLWDARKEQIVLCMVWGSINCQAKQSRYRVPSSCIKSQFRSEIKFEIENFLFFLKKVKKI